MNTYTGATLEEALSNAASDRGVDVSAIQYITKNEEGASEVVIDAFTNEDVKEFLFDYLGNFFMGIDCDLEAAIEEKDGSFIVNLNAENNAVLIGKMGKTLAALNTVVRSAVNSEFKKRIDVLIDVNRYKDDRYHKVMSMAKRIGKQVQKSHVDVELDPMPNDERKVIHKALANWHNLSTESAGEGSNRHICIKYVPDETSEETSSEAPTETTEENA